VAEVRLQDGTEKQVPDGTTVAEAIAAVRPPKADRIIAAKVDGRPVDLSYKLNSQQQLEFLPADDDCPESLEILRHSASHVMAQAVREIYGRSVQYTIGPALTGDFKYGFYYDFDLPHPITNDDLADIEKRMKKIIAARQPFVRSELSLDQARKQMQQLGQHYKVELIDEIAQAKAGQTVSFYQQDTFIDLCRGPHLPHTGWIGAVKLMAVAGAYWRGDAANKMLTRIYGVAFFSKDRLRQHLEKVEEARKRDHRLLGRQLDLYSTHDDIGPGLVLWHPKGATVRRLIEQFWIDEHRKRGYQLVYSPHIANEKIYQISGHLEAYSEMMYSPMQIDEQNYRVKPMNCPGHIKIYQSQTRSYRDLPIRLCELGTVYRYEPTGTLHGMLRVRGFTQDDSHIFCTIDQLAGEVEGILDLVDFMMSTFGYEYNVCLSTRPDKSIGSDEEWEWSTHALREALERRRIQYEVDEGGGVFYAPKIDVKLVDSLGREWQGPTIQVDLNLPKRFNCVYVGADNAEHEVVIVHRTVLGSMERFVGGLIEHYAGAFPLWLSPVQAAVLPVSEKFNDYAGRVVEQLRLADIRAELDSSDDKVGAKIRRATLQKVPYMLVVGQKEQDSGTVAPRTRKGEQLAAMSVEQFIQTADEQIRSRAL